MTKKNTSPYEQVKSILDLASGSSTADYDGYGKFWHLPIHQLLELKIYGVLMIAPLPPVIDCNEFSPDPAPGIPTNAKVPSCCSNNPDASGTSPKPINSPGRGANSGLIKALKGEFPFDGTQFPKFMWGGGPVSAANITFISNWIDDGCPTEAHAALLASEYKAPLASATSEMLSSVKPMSTKVLVGAEKHPVSLRSTNQIKDNNGQLKQRKNIEFLNDDELCKLKYAVGYLKGLNAYPLDVRSYNSWAQMHGNACQHGWEQFLPWHRMMLYQFEKSLQDIVPDVTLAYWDWPMDIYQNGQVQKPGKGYFPKGIDPKLYPEKYYSGVVPTAARCYLNKDSIARLISKGVPQQIADIDGYMYNSGIEIYWVIKKLIGEPAFDSNQDLIIQELKNTNPLWHDLRFPGMIKMSQFHHHYPVKQDLDDILNIPTWRVLGGGALYDQSFGVLDLEPHNTIHIWSGGFNPDNSAISGDMLNNLTAGYDPIFYMHHTNVDRVWSDWQEQHPGQVAADPYSQLPGLPYSISDSWDMRQLGYEYVNASVYYETHDQSSISMLRTEKTNLHPKVLANHQRATLKLHDVIPPLTSFGLRVFINQPDANENTPVINNPNYAGYFSLFGHGDCIGGPGHCAMPAPQGKFDKRPMNHNRPGNYRMDISDTVAALAAKGETNLDIKLVTISPNPDSTHDKLKMKGLSINFH